MRLIKEEDEIIRKHIENQLESLSENAMIHLDKELLERLIFTELVTVDGLVLKYPIWTGSFLRKIDLSEISFDDVCWSFKINKLIPEFKKSEKYLIDLSYTNAKIDFSTRYPGTNDLIRCNFSHVDLKNSNIVSINNMVCVDISYTNAEINLNNLIAGDCNFSGLDLSSYEIDSRNLSGEIKPFLVNTNLSETGISIKHSDKKYERLLNFLIKDNLLENCYINGKFIFKSEASSLSNETIEILNNITKEINYVKKKR